MNASFLPTLAVVVLLLGGEARAQDFVLAPDSLAGVEQTFEPPARFKLYQSVADDELITYILTVVDANGQVHLVDDLGYRGAAVETEGAWRVTYMGCGTGCFTSWILEGETGRLAAPVFAPLYIDSERSFVVVAYESGVQLFDPFDPSRSWRAEIPEDSPHLTALVNAYAEIEVNDQDFTLRSTGGGETVTLRLPDLE